MVSSKNSSREICFGVPEAEPLHDVCAIIISVNNINVRIFFMKQFIRKADVILFIALVAIGLASSVALGTRGSANSGAEVVIKSGGSLYARYPLSEDRTLEVQSPDNPKAYNTVIIKDGKVSVTEASCKNQVCVRQGVISAPGETLVCLPNRLVVSIENSEGGGYDSITS